jgi:hypothetical protein
MGGNRHFFIESKAFELKVDHGGGAYIVRLYERGKDTLRSIFMGKASATTLLDSMEELVSQKQSGNFVRTIREGETVFIAQRCTNSKGRYVSIQAIHRGGRRGLIIISEGRNCSGWQRFTLEFRRVLFPEPKVSQNQQTLGAARPVSMVRKEKSFAAVASGSGKNNGGGIDKGKAIIQEGFPKFEEHSKPHAKSNSLTINMGNISAGRDKGEGCKVNLNINLQLSCGSNGEWSIINASIGESPAKATPREPIKPSIPTGRCGPSKASTSGLNKAPTSIAVQGPRPKWIWQPRKADTGLGSGQPKDIPGSGQLKGISGSGQLKDFSGNLENNLVLPIVPKSAGLTETTQSPMSIAPPLAQRLEPSTSCDELQRSWGSSADWVLELRDGKRISIPLSLIRQPTVETAGHSDPSDEPKVLLLEGFSDLGSTDDNNLGLDGEEDEEDDVSVVWADPENGDSSAMVCCEESESALEIEPLATMGPIGSFDQPLEMGGDVLACEPTKSSEWVLGKYHEFGEYIGASYEGYEEEVLNLLRSIDARRPPQHRNKECTMKGEKQGGRGSRELKGLLSSINYDNGSARRRMDPRERVLSITQ